MSDQPTRQDLEAIKKALPAVFREQRKKKATRYHRVVADGHQELCRICGANFVPIKTALRDKICGGCNGELDSGCTALLCIDGRYAFLKPDGSSDAQKLSGQIIGVTVPTMNAIKKKLQDEKTAGN